jgi:hypothetical protein
MKVLSLTKSTFAAAALLFTMSSCEELTSITVDTEKIETVVINFTEETATDGITETLTIDPTKIPELGDRLNDIEQLDIDYVRYRFRNFSGNEEALVQGSIIIEADGINLVIPETVVKPAADDETVFNADINNAQAQSLANAIKSGESRTISISLTAQNPDAQVTIDFIIGLKAKVQVLN